MTETVDLNNNAIYFVSLVLFYWMLTNLVSHNNAASDVSETTKQRVAPRDVEGTALLQGSALRALRDIDPDFIAEDFLSDAANTYETVIAAFIKGDLNTLRPLLGATVLATFELEIESRQSRYETLEFTLINEPSLTVLGVTVERESVEVTILFSSEAVQCSLSADGTIVDGDPKRIVQVRHTWTFSRQFSNRNQPWQVVSTA